MATKDPKIVEAQSKTQLLLILWEMGGLGKEVKGTELRKKATKSSETAKVFQAQLEGLARDGAIATVTKNRSLKISMTEIGKQILTASLSNDGFAFKGTQISTKVANALLKWIRQIDAAPVINGRANTATTIASYEEFKPVALETYDRLNSDYNFDNLVPIYRIRREMGDRVTRSQFNDWMLEMQANDILQLIGGEMTDISPDKAEDSIRTELGGVRYYVRHLSI